MKHVTILPISVIAFLSMIVMNSHQLMAQEQKTVEHKLMAGIGLSDVSANQSTAGFVLSVQYGLDIAVSPSWSMMPLVGLRMASETLFRPGKDGADYSDFRFVDAGLLMCWNGVDRFVFGVGPYFSYALSRDKYYVDADPSDPLNDRAKIKKTDIGLQPFASYDISNKWSICLQGHIGLLDASMHYPDTRSIKSHRLKTIEASIARRF